MCKIYFFFCEKCHLLSRLYLFVDGERGICCERRRVTKSQSRYHKVDRTSSRQSRPSTQGSWLGYVSEAEILSMIMGSSTGISDAKYSEGHIAACLRQDGLGTIRQISQFSALHGDIRRYTWEVK